MSPPVRGVGKAGDTALVPDIAEIQNKGISLWIAATYSVSEASTCSAGLYDISRRNLQEGPQFQITYGSENANSPLRRSDLFWQLIWFMPTPSYNSQLPAFLGSPSRIVVARGAHVPHIFSISSHFVVWKIQNKILLYA